MKLRSGTTKSVDDKAVKTTGSGSDSESSGAESSSKTQFPGIITATLEQHLAVPCRSHLHKFLKASVPFILACQKIRNPVLDKLYGFITLFGHEEFYILVLGFILWTIDTTLGERLMILVPVGIYFSNFFKNLFQIPRPPSPPVWTGGTRAEKDFGFPSTHSVNHMSMPMYIVYYAYSHPTYTPSWSFGFAFMVALLWSLNMAFSRIYLGVHSPADVSTGLVAGALLLLPWINFSPLLDAVYTPDTSTTLVVLNCITIAIVMMSLHPHAPPPHKTYGESCCHIGTALGTVLGAHLHAKQFGTHNLLLHSPFATDDTDWATVALRVVGGVFVLALTIVLSKEVYKFSFTTLCNLTGIPYIPYGEYKHPSKKKGWALRIDAPVRCLTYATMTSMATYMLPMVVYALGHN